MAIKPYLCIDTNTPYPVKFTKTLILYSVILFSLSQSDAVAQQFDGGILAGGVLSQVDGDDWVGYNKVGFLAGGFVNLELSPSSSLQMEMQYIQKGSRKPADLDSGYYFSYLLRLHYLEIPVLYQFTFLKRFQVEVGPAVDVLLGYSEQRDEQEVPNIYPFRSVTLAGIVGASGYITKHLKATFRFNYSLLSLRKPQPPDSRGKPWRKIFFEWGQYNNMMSLSLAYQFKGRKNF